MTLSFLAALINLDKPGVFLHWGVIQISLANVIVIGLMVAVFLLAIFIHFDRKSRRR